MTPAATPEFSRRVPLARLGAEPFRQEIAATAAERAALAARFDLVALDRLGAVVELSREGADRYLLRGVIDAEFAQTCVVTLEPVGGTLHHEFALLYGPPEAAEADPSITDAEVDFEPLVGDAIDIGEAVSQEFSLALPPFPRDPDAVIEIETPAADAAGPFAALSQLVERRRD